MPIPEPRTLTFTDQETNQTAFMSIRALGGSVGLALSLENEGDVEVFLGPAEVSWLTRTLSSMQRGDG